MFASRSSTSWPFLAHLTEWAAGAQRSREPAVVREPVAVGGASGGTPAATAATPRTPRHEEPRRMEMFGRIGVALTVVGCVLHVLGLVTRGLGRRPGPGALGQHVRVHAGRHLRRQRDVPVLMQRYHLRWMGVLVTGFLVVVLMLDVLVLYQDAGPLRARAALLLAGHPRARRDHRLRRVRRRRRSRSALFLVKDRADRRGDGPARRLPHPAARRSRRSSGSPTG